MSDRDDFVLALPPSVLRRRGARMLDPVAAPRPRKDDQVSAPVATSTAYLGGHLLVRGLPTLGARARGAELTAVLDRLGYAVSLRPDPRDERLAAVLTEVAGQVDGLVEQLDRVYQTRLLIEPTGETPLDVDPWALVLAARSVGVGDVDLEHLVIPGPGGAYWEGHGPGAYWEGHGPGAYWEGHAGAGTVVGRSPVSVAIGDPSAGRPELKRHPVVVIPDTGLGAHPWFDGHPRVHVLSTIFGVPVAQSEPGAIDPEAAGVREDLLGHLDRLSGHGTFIAGIIRQTAPDAVIVALPVLDSSGTAAESDVTRALVALLVSHVVAQQAGRTEIDPQEGGAIDVLSLSLGFYHQDGEVADHPVRDLVQLFAHYGVLVVAAAGNQATRVPLYPAGWAHPAGSGMPRSSTPPLVSVGALNPDGASVAMFSNAGPWVTTHRRGVNVVSTLPTTFDASGGASRRTSVDDLVRSTPDPDGHAGGFGVWSGTSFAAPWLAGALAAQLAVQADAQVDVKAMRARARAAQGVELGWA